MEGFADNKPETVKVEGEYSSGKLVVRRISQEENTVFIPYRESRQVSRTSEWWKTYNFEFCGKVLDEEAKRAGDHMTSAAAFVEGGIQEANDDACSICLEEFCDSDPSTVTCCKHEFHLQCILEWCQRSSQCPMCWQPISLKDPSSQELLDAVERERNIRLAPRNPTIFHHPALGDFELQHLPVGANDAELEERIIQHLAAAAAMGRAHHLSRREGHRGRPSGHGRPHFLVFSAHPNGAHSGPVSGSVVQVEGESQPAAVSVARTSVPIESTGDDSPRQILIQTDQVSSSASGSPVTPTNRQGISLYSRSSAGYPSSPTQDRAGPSEFQTISESLKSKWNAVSMRYKESLNKSTKGWRERLFPRHTSVADHNTEVRREVVAGINNVPHMMGNLEIRDNSVGNIATESSNQSANCSADEAANQSSAENREENPSNEVSSSAAGAASSVSI